MDTNDTPTPPTPDDAPTPGGVPEASPITHIYVLLDRSGSMNSIRDDVIGGFNSFLEAQRSDADAVLTLVQFDTEHPDEVVFDAADITGVPPLNADAYIPRGGTPLLDATGLLLARARERTVERRLAGKPENPLVVTITDGHENQSREFTRARIRGLVAELEAEDWAFVYLTAGIDAYDEARTYGYHSGAVQSWAPDGPGAALAFDSLSAATSAHRGKGRRGRAAPSEEFFETGKGAEADRRRKRGDDR